MEQILLILFLVLLVGFGAAKKKSAAKKTMESQSRSRIPTEDLFPSAQNNAESTEPIEEYDFGNMVSEDIKQDETPEYRFVGMEASQEESVSADTTSPSVCSEIGEKGDKPLEDLQGVEEFSLRDAVINQAILQRKYS